MSQANPTDFDIISSSLGIDIEMLKSFDAATVKGLLATAKKKTEKEATSAVLTPIMDAIKAADVTLPAGFRVIVDQTEKGELTVSLKKKKTSSSSAGNGNRGKSLKVTKGPKSIAGKTFSSGAECVRALNASDPEKFPIPSGEFSAPQRLKSWKIEFDFIEKDEDEKDSSSDKGTRRNLRNTRRS